MHAPFCVLARTNPPPDANGASTLPPDSPRLVNARNPGRPFIRPVYAIHTPLTTNRRDIKTPVAAFKDREVPSTVTIN